MSSLSKKEKINLLGSIISKRGGRYREEQLSGNTHYDDPIPADRKPKAAKDNNKSVIYFSTSTQNLY
jgi:hypothetical protein